MVASTSLPTLLTLYSLEFCVFGRCLKMGSCPKIFILDSKVFLPFNSGSLFSLSSENDEATKTTEYEYHHIKTCPPPATQDVHLPAAAPECVYVGLGHSL